MASSVWSGYVLDTRALIGDNLGLFTSPTQLDRFLNEARRQTAYHTSCLRALISGASPFGAGAQPGTAIPGAIVPGSVPDAQPGAGQQTTNSFNTIPNVEMYPFAYANPILRKQYQGFESVIDVIDVAVSWGAMRPTLGWLPWEDLQAYARAYNIGVTAYPYYWSTNGDGEHANVWLWPMPSIGGVAGEMEWDCFCSPTEIHNDNDFEAIPRPFRDPVKFYAAYLVYLTSNRYADAQTMLSQFMRVAGVGRAASDRGKVPDYYFWQNRTV